MTDARAVGIGDAEMRKLVAAGAALRLRRGWYALPIADQSAEEAHRLKTLAVVRHYAGSAWASHYSALLLHHLPLYDVIIDRVHVTHSTGRQTRTLAHTTVHGALADNPRLPVDELRSSVHPALAIVQTGVLRSPMSALVAANPALRRGLITAEDIGEALATVRSGRGLMPLAAHLSTADGRCESPGETRLAFAMRALGLRFIPQVEIDTEDGRKRVDFLLDDERVIVEFDGKLKYESRADLIAEKRREDALRALGYVVVRIVWSDLDNPHRIAAKIEAARRLARRMA